MKQQILIIHGGHQAGKKKDFLKHLQEAKMSLEDLRFKGWKANLQEDLGNTYEVFQPKMPNPQMARYEEWKIWFEKYLRLLNNNPILIGHSLGGVFLAKYFSQEKVLKKPKAIFLVAAPYFERREFALPKDLKGLQKKAGKIFLYHSKDDHVVGFDHFERYQKALPQKETRILKNRGHFHQEHFPEIVKDIKAL